MSFSFIMFDKANVVEVSTIKSIKLRPDVKEIEVQTLLIKDQPVTAVYKYATAEEYAAVASHVELLATPYQATASTLDELRTTQTKRDSQTRNVRQTPTSSWGVLNPINNISPTFAGLFVDTKTDTVFAKCLNAVSFDAGAVEANWRPVSLRWAASKGYTPATAAMNWSNDQFELGSSWVECMADTTSLLGNNRRILTIADVVIKELSGGFVPDFTVSYFSRSSRKHIDRRHVTRRCHIYEALVEAGSLGITEVTRYNDL